jgi:acetyl-CoA acetyltransferase
VNLRARTAIVGLGDTPYFGNADETPIALAHSVVQDALADAGLSRSDIDGLVVHIGSPRGADYDETARALNLRVRFAAQTWSHGRFASTAITHAALALIAGLADCVLAIAAFNNSSFGKHGTRARPTFHESLRDGGGPHAETLHAGLAAPIGGAAMATQRYLHRYGVHPDKLATIAVTLREHAMRNPRAAMRKPLTQEEYLDGRFIVEPLRLYDCSVVVDAAVAVIMTRADRAKDCRSAPVFLLGAQGIHAGPNEYIFGQPGLGINQDAEFDYRPAGAGEPVFRMAGATPADIDSLQLYDAFSPQVLWTLERFGFCAVGEAADFIQDGRIALGGALPVNTSGGHLSEGHFNGWGQIAETVRQLRGEAGDRQIPDARLIQWATTLGDSLIFGVDGHGGSP